MTHECKKDIPIKRILKAFKELKYRKKYIKSVMVGCPPGMGDSYWVMTKMKSFKERNSIDKLKIAVHQDPIHYYTADFLRMFPFVDEVVGRKDTFQIANLYDKTSPGFMLKNKQKVDYFIDFGALMWLKGLNLEDIYPECKTDFNCPIELPEYSRRFAQTVKEANRGKLVLFYTSSIGNNKNWNGGAWDAKDWLSLAEHIFKHSGIHPILIGAQWDKDYAEQIHDLDEKNIVQDMVGETSISQTLSLVREANLVVSFACGIPMVATYMGVPTVIFWAINGISRKERFNSEFKFTWVPPKERNNGRYIPITYDSPEAKPIRIFNKIKGFL